MHCLVQGSAYVPVALSKAALAIVGVKRFLKSPFMQPGAVFLTKEWEKLAKEGPASQVSFHVYPRLLQLPWQFLRLAVIDRRSLCEHVQVIT